MHGHTLTPAALLGLAVHLYGRAPTACLIAIPATNFDLGAPLSPQAACALTQALILIRRLIDDQH
jgi:hypothetical protein